MKVLGPVQISIMDFNNTRGFQMRAMLMNLLISVAFSSVESGSMERTTLMMIMACL